MTVRAKVHRDGKGATFMGLEGYVAFRLRRIESGTVHPEIQYAVVKVRHQRHAHSPEIHMLLNQWEAILAMAREDQSIADGGRP